MIYNSTSKIDHQQAKNILEIGGPLRDFTVEGSIEFDGGSKWKKDVFNFAKTLGLNGNS